MSGAAIQIERLSNDIKQGDRLGIIGKNGAILGMKKRRIDEKLKTG
jgi:hypothetical protein